MAGGGVGKRGDGGGQERGRVRLVVVGAHAEVGGRTDGRGRRQRCGRGGGILRRGAGNRRVE